MFQRLRALRKRLADEAGMPPYIVFSDKTLRAMVRMRPATEDELLEVPGVGQKKLATYGSDFLAELND
jgi:ATP-dependent DNA helicase RecQ